MDEVAFENALAKLRAEYEQTLPGKLGEIEARWRALNKGDWDADQFKTYIRLAHTLAGSSGTYGFHEVSSRARALERYAKSLSLENGPHPEQRNALESLLKALLESPRTPSPQPAPSGQPAWTTADASPNTARNSAAMLNPAILVYEPDVRIAREISANLRIFGFVVRFAEGADDLGAMLAEEHPAAVLLDWDYAEQAGPPMRDVLAAAQASPPPPALIFMSERDALQARLEAVRRGATGYLVKPLDVASLLETLDAQTTSRSAEPYRILIVEDDASLATWSSAILMNAGMVTRIVTEPLKVMPPLIEFRPDLILIDLHMPGITGTEIAAILRQELAYVTIPIVFLSGERDENKQHSAMLLGADDFLTKPIEPGHLLSSVTSRVQRARVLRSLAERDSLTGLLNHTRFKEQLAIQVSRALRQGGEVAFVMLDLDHFKEINDTYGHPTGDRVIKNLALLFKQRLRKTDVLGRYGGEEFGVIMPDTGGGAAYQVMEELRVSFAQIAQYSAGKMFHVTLSAGIATLPPWQDAAALNEAADRALYQAKRGGRNQIVYAAEE